MKLYCFGESGNAYKCALALTFADVDWEPVYVDFFNGEARTPAFRAINEMGEVPVLVDGDTTLTQSGVILDYISSKTGKLGGKSAAERREVLRWVFWDNHKFSGVIATTRFLSNFLPEDKRPAGVIPFQQGRLKAAYTILNDHLANRPWVAGAALTIADLSHRLDTICQTHGTLWQQIKGWDANWTDPAHELATVVQSVAGDIRQTRVQMVTRLPASDASRWRRMGVPAICYGPQPELASGVDDHVYEKDLTDCAGIYESAARRLLGAG